MACLHFARSSGVTARAVCVVLGDVGGMPPQAEVAAGAATAVDVEGSRSKATFVSPRVKVWVRNPTFPPNGGQVAGLRSVLHRGAAPWLRGRLAPHLGMAPL